MQTINILFSRLALIEEKITTIMKIVKNKNIKPL
jgi:glycine cleavage system regulatory protein